MNSFHESEKKTVLGSPFALSGLFRIIKKHHAVACLYLLIRFSFFLFLKKVVLVKKKLK